MSEVHEDEQGLKSRNRRGQLQSEKIRKDKSDYKKGTRKDKYVNYIKSKPLGLFSSYHHFEDPYSNQVEKEKVKKLKLFFSRLRKQNINPRLEVVLLES